MKLLTITNRYFLLLTALLFALGSLGLYLRLDWSLHEEMDEQLVAQQRQLLARTERTGQLPSFEDATVGQLTGNRLPVGFSDTVLYNAGEQEMATYRQLRFGLRHQGRAYTVALRQSLIATEDVLTLVVSTMLAVLGGLLLSVVVLNRWLTQRLWQPFRRTMALLGRYDLHQRQPLLLPPTRIEEFAALNQALTGMSERLTADYEQLREFTENAAHETQTPLAIMQVKLEELLQLPALATNEAGPLLADLYGATLRLSRLHQALALLSKIENRQFPQAVALRLDQVLTEKSRQFESLAEVRDITLNTRIDGYPALHMHPGLADSLVQNLLQNALKHNLPGGRIDVQLTPKLLEISNTGPAVTGDPARFFERFRKHHATSDSPGLGLAIVQHICRYYDFTVEYLFSAPDSRHILRVRFAAEGGR